MNPEMLHLFTLSLAGIVMVLAAINDLRHFRIPNLASLSLLLLFPLYVYAAPVTVVWINHLIVFGVVLVLGYLLYLKNWVGAGDIKLLASVSLWAGTTHVLTFLFITALSGGILGLGLAVFSLVKQQMKTGEKNTEILLKTPIPYGMAIAIGGLCTLVLLSHPDLLQAKG